MRHALGNRQGVSFRSVFNGTDADRSVPSLQRQRTQTLPPMTSASIFADKVESDADDAAASSPTLALSKVLPQARFFGCKCVSINEIAHDVTRCQPGDTVLYRIGEEDPNEFIATALARGAAAILTEQLLPCPLPQCVIGSVDLALAEISSARHDAPDRKLLTVGILGHSGKTSTCMLMATLTKAQGLRTAYQCDLGSSDGVLNATSQSGLPAGAELIEWLSESADCCSKLALIEINDQAARDGRYDAIEFDVLVVTGRGLRSDDFGPCALQCLLERLMPSGVVIVSEDDRRSLQLIDEASCKRITYGTSPSSEFGAVVLDGSGGMSTLMLSAGDTSAMMETPLCGLPMASNIAAATAFGSLLGANLHDIAEKLNTLRTIPGRGQRLVEYGQATVVLETGGSDFRIRHALRTAKQAGAGGKVWCILAIGDDDCDDTLAGYGCVIERWTQHAVVTAKPGHAPSFLERSHHLLDGVKECAAIRLVADRTQAIEWAIKHAAPRDTIVVVSGTGATSAYESRAETLALEEIVAKARQEIAAAEDNAASDTAQNGTAIKLKLFK